MSIKLVKILKNEGVDFIIFHVGVLKFIHVSKKLKTLTELFFDSINDLPPLSTGGVWSSKDARELETGTRFEVLVVLVLLIQIGLVKYQQNYTQRGHHILPIIYLR